MTIKPQIYPSHVFEDELRKRGIDYRVMWEQRGPKNTGVSWMTCYLVGRSVALVQTYRQGGWEVYTPHHENDIDKAVEDALRRCGALEQESSK